jgi:hypothetical protein
MVSLGASGWGRRRRMFVAALFAYTESAVVSEPFPTHAHSQARADELVIRMFTQEAPSLVRLARLFTDDRNAAEDLVQEAFIRLHRSANRIEHADRAAPYLRSIVLNLARDHNRRGLCRCATAPRRCQMMGESCLRTRSCVQRTRARLWRRSVNFQQDSETVSCSSTSTTSREQRSPRPLVSHRTR